MARTAAGHAVSPVASISPETVNRRGGGAAAAQATRYETNKILRAKILRAKILRAMRV